MKTSVLTRRTALFSILLMMLVSCEKQKEDCFLEGNGQLNDETFDFQTNWCVTSFQKVYRFSGNDKRYIKNQFGLIFEPTTLTSSTKFSFSLLAVGEGTASGNQIAYQDSEIKIKLIRQKTPKVESPGTFQEYDQLVYGKLVVTKTKNNTVEGKLSFKIVAPASITEGSESDTLEIEELNFKGTYTEFEQKEF